MKLKAFILAALLATTTQAHADDGVAEFCDHYSTMVMATAQMRDNGMTFTQVVNATAVSVNNDVDWERMLFSAVTAATAELYTHPVLSRMSPVAIKQMAFTYCVTRQGE